MSDDWTVTEARARFSELLAQAATAPQIVTRNGRRAAVVVSIDEWNRRTRGGETLAAFLARSPLRSSRMKLERDKTGPRAILL